MSTLIKPPCYNGNTLTPLTTTQLNEIRRSDVAVSAVKDEIYVIVHSYDGDEWIHAELLGSDNIDYQYAKFLVFEEASGPDDQHSVELYKITSNIDMLIKLFDEDGEFDAEHKDEIESFNTALEASTYHIVRTDDLIDYNRDGYYPLIWRVDNANNAVILYFDLRIDGVDGSSNRFDLGVLNSQLETIRQHIGSDAHCYTFYYPMEEVVEYMMQYDEADIFKYGNIVTLSLDDAIVKECFDFISSFTN